MGKGETGVGFVSILLVAIGALAPLQTELFGVRIYTPYIPFALTLLLAMSVWVLRQDGVSVRREEVAYVAVSALSVGFSFFSVDPQSALDGALLMVYAACVYLAVRYLLSTGFLTRRGLIRVFAIVFLVLSAVGILQLVLQKNFGVVSAYFGESSAAGTYAESGTRLRVSGTFGNANVFSQVYLLYGTLIVSLLLFSRSGAGRIGVALWTSLLLLFLVAASLSRSGMLAAVVMFVALYLYWVKSDRQTAPLRFVLVAAPLLALAMASAVMFLAAMQAGLPGLSRLTDTSDGGRLALAEGAWMLVNEPQVALFGVGSGQFFKGVAEYGVPLAYKEWRDVYDINSSVHNWTLQVAVENGLVILFLYVYALARTVARGWSVRRSRYGWIPASLGVIIAVLYLVPLQLTTAGLTPWLLTPVSIMLAWIQYEYDQATGTAGR